MDLPVAPVELHGAVEGHGGQRRLERLHLGVVCLRMLQVIGKLRASLAAARRREVGLDLRDLAGPLADVILDALEPLGGHGLTRDLVRDDLGVRVGGGIDLITVPVIPVEMRVDDVADGLGREVAQLLDDEAGGRGLGMRVHDHHAVVALDDGSVAVDLVGGRGHRHVHAVGHLLDVELGVALRGSLVATAIHRGNLLSRIAPPSSALRPGYYTNAALPVQAARLA